MSHTKVAIQIIHNNKKYKSDFHYVNSYEGIEIRKSQENFAKSKLNSIDFSRSNKITDKLTTYTFREEALKQSILTLIYK